MGKGDIRSRKGKIKNGSFGVKRKARVAGASYPKAAVNASKKAEETVKEPKKTAKKTAKKTKDAEA